MTFGLTPTGFVPMRQLDIQNAMNADALSAFGATWDISPKNPWGQLSGIFSAMLALVWEGEEADYNSMYPETAEGINLDYAVEFNNISRKPATFSAVTVILTGTNGTVVPDTFQMQVAGNPNAIFQVLGGQDYTIEGTNAFIQMIATETGPIAAPAGTVTTILTPVTGIASGTNAADALIGQNIETDVQLRARRAQELQRSGTATVEGIRNALLNLADVVQAGVIENVTDETDANGLPPHSFEAFVLGGQPQEIVDTIWNAKPAGIATYGNESAVVTDSQGILHTIFYSTPEDIEIYVIVNIVKATNPNDGAFPPTGATDVANAVLAYGNALQIAQDVLTHKISAAIDDAVNGIATLQVLIGTAPDPTLPNNIDIGFGQIASFDSSRITVNVS